ncbi:(S)-benzoin forming benzil reductase [Alkalihalobacillus sp. MEB130]|uniref:(S)-benzoin forming benzil reductase n=1 Tax=Alkalihalobacillus sp. MEB130 TaxID=2976704 RepID=UPI0028DD7DFD|nr:(S)-benzoin forming benzil reductase [Alkalihalobacillus sp. MEB130]MDT8860962.1 (S)-benzoin forming benzil reductase [Alkalihalobacillus sp. MEB130]
MNYVIVTGSSKGLGEAIASLLLDQENTTIICIARSTNKNLEEKAILAKTPYFFYPFDLANLTEIQPLVEQLFTNIMLDHANHVHLINNAGILDPIKPIDRSGPEEIIKNIDINLVAPMILTSEFLKRTKDFNGEKRIINISSGAGKRPIFGWSCYGTSKAGLDLFSQTTAIEQEEVEYPVKVCSFGPGIMDTNMQEQIRTTSKQDFIQVDTFQRYKKEDQLLPPSKVANMVVDLLYREDFPNGETVSVSQYL